MGNNPKITALVHTYNADRCLDAVLASLVRFDELLVCDMGSTDRTLEICAAHHARVIVHEHTGYVEPARNFAIQSAAHPWVMIVDADEILPDALVDYIYRFVEQADAGGYSGLEVPKIEFFMGRGLRSSYPNYVTRLVRRDAVHWPETIHSMPVIDGKIGRVDGRHRSMAMLHYSNPSIEDRIEKINRYTDQEVARKAHKWKYRSWAMTWLSAAVRFVKGYVVKGGFLDGKAGFIYCRLEVFYKFAVLYKIWEYRAKQN